MKFLFTFLLSNLLCFMIIAQDDSSLVGTTTPFILLKPVYVVDGLKLTETQYFSLGLKKQDIESSKLINNKKSIKKYGEIGKNGIIEISTNLIIKVNGRILIKPSEKLLYLKKYKLDDTKNFDIEIKKEIFNRELHRIIQICINQ